MKNEGARSFLNRLEVGPDAASAAFPLVLRMVVGRCARDNPTGAFASGRSTDSARCLHVDFSSDSIVIAPTEAAMRSVGHIMRRKGKVINVGRTDQNFNVGP